MQWVFMVVSFWFDCTMFGFFNLSLIECFEEVEIGALFYECAYKQYSVDLHRWDDLYSVLLICLFSIL